MGPLISRHSVSDTFFVLNDDRSLSPAKQMPYLYPRFYNCSVPAPFLGDLPQLAQLCNGTKPPLASDKGVEHISSMRGEKFISFAKSSKYVDGKTWVKRKQTNFVRTPWTLTALIGTEILASQSDIKTAVTQLSCLGGFLKELYYSFVCNSHSLSGTDSLSSQAGEGYRHTLHSRPLKCTECHTETCD